MARGGRPWRAWSALGVGLLLVASCSSGTEGGNDDAAPSTATGAGGQRSVEYLAPEPGAPTPGGTLAYALEADADGFDPTTARWSGPALIMANAVFDPLAAFDADGAARPYLAESIEPNDDYTRWTITLRRRHLPERRVARRRGTGAVHHQDAAVPADRAGHGPRRRDDTGGRHRADDGGGHHDPTVGHVPRGAHRPGRSGPGPRAAHQPRRRLAIGQPHRHRTVCPAGVGEGSRLTLDRNDTYWQDGLPYLDNVAFVPISDNNARDDALLRGDVDMEFTTFSSSVQRLEPLARPARSSSCSTAAMREQLFLLMNNDKAPFDDVRIRKAVALAFDYDTYLQVAKEPDAIRSEGPFTRSSPWFVDTDFPTYDLEAAKALVAEYEAEVGPAAFEFRTTDNPENQAIGQAIADMLTAAGMDVTTTSESQTSYPTSIVFGAYELAYVRLFGSPDPDGDAHWFLSENAPPVGQGTIGLNLARMRDAQVDEAIMRGRTSTDRNERAEAYADLQRRLTELVPYVWMNESLKYLAADNSVHDFLNGPLPDGTPAMPIVGGVTRLTHTWKS
ncbi:MAG: ABC transporter substrate-binding protein [Acidimicrobiales bacterium]